MPALKKDDKVYVAGHRGLVGSAIVRKLEAEGFINVITRTRDELNLESQADTLAFLKQEEPDVVVVAAAKVGGIQANNTYPADFIGINLQIQNNLVWGSHQADIQTLCFLGSSCIYPRETAQPIPETALLTGPPEPTNAPYAIAKIAGLYLCDALKKQYGRHYFTVMPPNVYGPNDNYNLQNSHVLPALIRKFHEAKPHGDVEVWGTGKPKREFLHSDDVADAVLFLLERPDMGDGFINVGTGDSITIRHLAETIQRIVGHKGEMVWNTEKPDGFPEKTMDVSRLFALGWRPKISLEDGIRDAYQSYLDGRVKAV
jgi:GDP-L-fucose synthase